MRMGPRGSPDMCLGFWQLQRSWSARRPGRSSTPRVCQIGAVFKANCQLIASESNKIDAEQRIQANWHRERLNHTSKTEVLKTTTKFRWQRGAELQCSRSKISASSIHALRLLLLLDLGFQLGKVGALELGHLLAFLEELRHSDISIETQSKTERTMKVGMAVIPYSAATSSA